MQVGLASWHWICGQCGYEAANFQIGINDEHRHTLINEEDRENGLKSVRESNFKDIIGLILENVPAGHHRLLDVGAAHGWFLNLASNYFEAYGIEPDHNIYEQAKTKNPNLIEGYFPDVLKHSEQFEVIVFNDVFEHIPAIDKTLDACNEHLTSKGLLILNLPCSAGIFYKLSKLILRMGFPEYFERMWQKGMPSPHLHYFGKSNLINLVERHGFKMICVSDLPSIRLQGLYDRVGYVGNISKLRATMTYLAIVLTLPVIKFFESDIAVVVFRKS
jgi:2-polyprenyl-3-methyl-5-hydroxy-6-metoxy-1,4-benzoquinol methylase